MSQADVQRLLAAIKASGLSRSEFARTVLVRDPRTLRRWLAGAPVPRAVINLLTKTPPNRKEPRHSGAPV